MKIIIYLIFNFINLSQFFQNVAFKKFLYFDFKTTNNLNNLNNLNKTYRGCCNTYNIITFFAESTAEFPSNYLFLIHDEMMYAPCE